MDTYSIDPPEDLTVINAYPSDAVDVLAAYAADSEAAVQLAAAEPAACPHCGSNPCCCIFGPMNPPVTGPARPRCPYCRAVMVRAKIEMDSFWLVCWLCECRAED